MKSHKFFFAVGAFLVIVFVLFVFAVVKPQFFATASHGMNAVGVDVVSTLNQDWVQGTRTHLVGENISVARHWVNLVETPAVGDAVVNDNAALHETIALSQRVPWGKAHKVHV